MTNTDKGTFSPTPRDALIIYRMLQTGYCTRQQIQRHIFGEGDSANVSMSRRWASMLKLGYIREKDRLFYATALGVQEVLMKVLSEEPEDLSMVDHGRIPGPPNPGNTKLLFEHHRLTAEAVFYFIERYEGLTQVKHFYVLPTPRLWGGRIKSDSAILLIYEKGYFSLFLIEVEVNNAKEDVKSKLNQYKRYKNTGAFKQDYQDQFQTQYNLPDLEEPFFRVMVIYANEKRMGETLKLVSSTKEDDRGIGGENLFRFTTVAAIMNRDERKPIWIGPQDKVAGKVRKRWEVE